MNDVLDNISTNLLFKIRDSREVSDNIAIIFIGSEDIKDLGGWPITRDYYSYAIHALKSSGAKVIGIDIFFDKRNSKFPEYDQIFSNFISSAGNIILPFTFSELITPKDGILVGLNPHFPDEIFSTNTAGLGYSNFGKQTISYKCPILVSTGDSVFTSFGLELAKEFLDISEPVALKKQSVIFSSNHQNDIIYPVDSYGQLRLNHFGGIDKFQTMSFVELLQTFKNSPEKLVFKDKLVIVAVSAPGLSILKSTPLDDLLPASLIHATVAENIINQTYIRETPILAEWFLIVCILLFTLWLWKSKKRLLILLSLIGLPAFYFILSFILFNSIYLYLPFIFPFLTFISVNGFIGRQALKEKQYKDSSVKKLLEEQINQKEKDLENARNDLNNLKDNLEREYTLSEQTSLTAEKSQETILKLESELRDLKTYIISDDKDILTDFKNIIYSENSKMKDVLALVSKVSKDDIPVIILGETGTGKEIIANAIHEKSDRKNTSFVGVNCGALTETLLDSELFGHEKGSFSGAHARRRGRFELANGGTIFLDEITETTPRFQARLLRVLQEGEFERVGGEQAIKVDVRVIAATNRNLQVEMETGRFRSDLYYRLNGFPISIPPLNERIEDIPLLCNHFLNKYKYKIITGFSDKAMDQMKIYSWPGNVRELENTIRRAAILAQSEERAIIRESDLPDEMTHAKNEPKIEITHQPLETQILESLRALKFARSAIGQTAKALGNKDRGTITEYFRGTCFEHLANNNFDIDQTAKSISDSKDEEVIDKVKLKITDYLSNVKIFTGNLKPEETDLSKGSIYKGLPKKYHPYLEKVINNLK